MLWHVLLTLWCAHATCVSDYPSYHSTTLTHVYVPLYVGQIEKMANAIKTWWTMFRPCIHSVVPSLSAYRRTAAKACGHIVPADARPALVFSCSTEGKTSVNERADIRASILAIMQSSLGDLTQCFRSVTACVYNIPVSGYPEGPNKAFESFLDGKCVHGDRGYAMYMEPDTVPIRDNWLHALHLHVNYPAISFWIAGSMFRGYLPLWLRHTLVRSVGSMYHINGNALYRISGFNNRNEADDNKIAEDWDQADQVTRPIGSTFAAYYHKISESMDYGMLDPICMLHPTTIA